MNVREWLWILQKNNFLPANYMLRNLGPVATYLAHCQKGIDLAGFQKETTNENWPVQLLNSLSPAEDDPPDR